MKCEDAKMPVIRGRLRLAAGKTFYTNKRHLKWLFSGISISSRQNEKLPYECFTHGTPLLRKLEGLDMQLQYNKIENLRIAVEKISLMTIRPGETFSFWKAIGKPTKQKGYQEGLILKNGKLTAGVGGGLCQLSNLIYWMTIHTPLTVTERHRHGYDVFPDSNRTQPFGSGATCFYNYGDLMIRNDTDQAFQLFLEIDETNLKGTWLCEKELEYRYEVYEKEHLIKPEYWGGYSRHNTLFRKKYDLTENQIDDEYVIENHAIMMYQPYLDSANE